MKSIGAHLLRHFLGFLGSGHDHLAEDGLLLFEFRDLLLEVVVFLFLVDHAQLQTPVQRLDQWPRRIHYLIVAIRDLIPHGLELLPEQLDHLVVLLQVLVGLPH